MKFGNKKPEKVPMYVYYIIVGVIIILLNMLVVPAVQERSVQKTDYSTFIENVEDGNVTKATVEENYIYYEMKDSNSGNMVLCKTVKMDDSDLVNRLLDAGVTMDEVLPESPSILVTLLLSYVVPIVIFIFIGRWLSKKMMSSMGGGPGGAMSFGKSNAKVYVKSSTGIKFSDVAGEDEAKDLLTEIVDYLHNPQKYTEIGASMPKGALLVGPPGTGKTLLAKAVAGEAEVPFFSISGSEFVEMFVGMGAAKVRDLFKQANEKAPCIVFIDEIDTIGKKRDGAGFTGGNDEREQTLNQLLTEMDGFDGNENIIVIAATNRSDVLDPALLRPGRFDRKVLVGRPDVKGREAILKVHAKNKPLAEDVDLKVVAQQTPGFVGADLENVLNEAALVAARRSKTKIDASDIDEAEDRVIAGPSKKDRQVSEHERKVVAYHEAGHTIVGLTLSSARDVHKVTIVPRGRAGGYMISLPKEDQMLSSKDELKEQLAGLMGGRVAEEIIFNVQTSGASNDFEQATQLARAMVTEYGMSEKLGPVQYEGNHAMNPGQFTTDKSYSAHTAQLIDEEIRSLLVEAHDKAAEIINANRETHALIAEALLKYETLDAAQIKSIYETGKMPVDSLGDSEEDNHALSYDEVKERIENKNKDEEE